MQVTASDSLAAYWAQSADAALVRLATSRAGLTDAEAARRRTIHGPNALANGGRVTPVSVVLRQLASPLVLLLLFAVVASMATGEWLDSAIVLLIIVASSGLSAAREWSAYTAAEALQHRLHPTTQVIRDGTPAISPVAALVPGDVVLLTAGAVVPADGVVLAASHCYVNEASLTGESAAVFKEPGVTSAEPLCTADPR